MAGRNRCMENQLGVEQVRGVGREHHKVVFLDIRPSGVVVHQDQRMRYAYWDKRRVPEQMLEPETTRG